MDTQIPANGAAQVPYKDNRELINGTLRHMSETFIGKVTGAGGIGGSLLNVPFEPAEIIAINQAGGTPAYYHSVFASDAAIHMSIILAAAANANPPTKTKVGTGNWTVGLTTQMAPDTNVVTVIVRGSRDIAGGL